mgnify:CR=1
MRLGGKDSSLRENLHKRTNIAARIILLSGTSKTILSEYLLRAILKLLNKEVPENGRNLHQYFTFFWLYANLGTAEVFNTSFHFATVYIIAPKLLHWACSKRLKP